MDLEANPLFNLPTFDAPNSDASSESSFTSSVEDIPPSIATPTAAVLYTVNIKNHVPVKLDLTDSNYTEWRCFMDCLHWEIRPPFSPLLQANP